MPEAIAVIFVTVVSVGIYIFARVQAASSSASNPDEALDGLKQQQQWLEQRLEVAKREKWDHEMIVRISQQLELTGAMIRKTSVSQGQQRA
jgi:hypothetical protein